jgi:hypothetical protein
MAVKKPAVVDNAAKKKTPESACSPTIHPGTHDDKRVASIRD